jgi:hypothetical protein
MLKKKFSIILLMLTVLTGISSAQSRNSASPWAFHSINNIGLLEGQTGSSFQLQTINGTGYKSWFCGIGVGLDFYRYRTIPLFFDLRKEFGKSTNKLFLFTDAGINFTWITDNEKTNYVLNDKFSNGFYFEGGVGYKIRVVNNNSLLLSLGYSYKKLYETYAYPVYVMYTQNADNNSTEKINYSLNRLSIKIGWEF